MTNKEKATYKALADKRDEINESIENLKADNAGMQDQIDRTWKKAMKQERGTEARREATKKAERFEDRLQTKIAANDERIEALEDELDATNAKLNRMLNIGRKSA